MKSKKWYIGLSVLVSLLMIPGVCVSEIYRCQKGKHVIYQADPCPVGYDTRILSNLGNAQPDSGGADSAGGASSGSKSAKGGSVQSTGQTPIVITRSSDSQFYLDGKVNGVDVHFLIDTGATLVAIPDDMVSSLSLVHDKAINVKSAAGDVKAYTLNIKELKVGDFVFKDITGETMPGGQPLLGMNVISLFDVSVKGDQMILSAKGS